MHLRYNVYSENKSSDIKIIRFQSTNGKLQRTLTSKSPEVKNILNSTRHR